MEPLSPDSADSVSQRLCMATRTTDPKPDGVLHNNDQHQVGDFHQTSTFSAAYKLRFPLLVEKVLTQTVM
jgi:hypothetical protein